jgi:hypothetical protein
MALAVALAADDPVRMSHDGRYFGAAGGARVAERAESEAPGAEKPMTDEAMKERRAEVEQTVEEIDHAQ